MIRLHYPGAVQILALRWRCWAILAEVPASEIMGCPTSTGALYLANVLRCLTIMLVTLESLTFHPSTLRNIQSPTCNSIGSCLTKGVMRTINGGKTYLMVDSPGTIARM